MNITRDELSALLTSHLEVTLAEDRIFSRTPRIAECAPTTRLILVAAGEVQYQLNDQSFLLGKGDAILVPAWSIRRWLLPNEEPCRYVWCEFVIHPPRPGGIPPIRARFSPEVDIASVLRIKKATAKKQDLLAEGELKALLARMLTTGLILSAKPAMRRGLQTGNEVLTEHVLSWLHHHYKEAITPADIARKAQLPVRQLRKLFVAHVNMTPQEYLAALRMYDARHRLRTTEQPVKQIALAVGYADPLYFSRHYRQYWGHPPRKERS